MDKPVQAMVDGSVLTDSELHWRLNAKRLVDSGRPVGAPLPQSVFSELLILAADHGMAAEVEDALSTHLSRLLLCWKVEGEDGRTVGVRLEVAGWALHVLYALRAKEPHRARALLETYLADSEAFPLLSQFYWTDEDIALLAEINQRVQSLPASLAEEVRLCLFDFFHEIGVGRNGEPAISADDPAGKAEVLQIYGSLLPALRAGDIEVIRRVFHGSPFGIVKRSESSFYADGASHPLGAA